MRHIAAPAPAPAPVPCQGACAAASRTSRRRIWHIAPPGRAYHGARASVAAPARIPRDVDFAILVKYLLNFRCRAVRISVAKPLRSKPLRGRL